MTLNEAEAYLEQYRQTLKVWSMMVVGVALGDNTALCFGLSKVRATLREIAQAHPELKYSADLLEEVHAEIVFTTSSRNELLSVTNMISLRARTAASGVL